MRGQPQRLRDTCLCTEIFRDMNRVGFQCVWITDILLYYYNTVSLVILSIKLAYSIKGAQCQLTLNSGTVELRLSEQPCA